MSKDRFETERLIIRDMTMDDCDIIAQSWGSAEVGRYMSDPYYKNGDELRAVFQDDELLNSETWTDEFYFVVLNKANNEIIGTASAWKLGDDVWGIGYTFDREWWNQGLGTELIGGLEQFVKANGGRYLSSEIAKDNIGSLKACYKNGFEDYREMTFGKSGTDIVFDALELRKAIE